MGSLTRKLIAEEGRVAAHNYHPVPVVVERARDTWIWDTDGNRYLDFMSAYSAVSHGHLHPRLVLAMHRQLEKVAVTSRAYHGTTLAPFLDRLCRMAGLDRALPMNTGAEAVETAIKAARRWGYRVKGIAPDQAQILVAAGNFHGRTTSIISFSTEADYRKDFGPFTPGFGFFSFGDMASLEAARTPNTCAVLVEPIQGEAGIVVPPEGWLRQVRSWCDRHDVLLIVDEIQSGLGRTGKLFAFEHDGIEPDGLIVGKALGGGLLPVSALVGTNALMNVFNPGSHGSTFGGNALAAAVGLEALQVIEDEQLVARSAVLGNHLLARLRAVTSPLVRQVRGRGLWVGVDLEPRHASARAVIERLAQRGVLSKETHETVIRIAPPLTITRKDLDWGIDQLIATLAEFTPKAMRPVKPVPVTTEPASPATQPVEQATARALLMMSPPDHFEVSYRINPWMDPKLWSLDAPRLAREARTGWQALRATYEALGARIEVEPPQDGLPDMVFTANSAVVLDGKVLLARFRHEQRQGEEAPNRAFFESLRVRGLVDSIHELPAGVIHEGAGDALWDAGRGVMWTGHGQRSDKSAQLAISQLFGVPTLALGLVDARFYHLDTCMCVLSGGEVLAYAPAFSAESILLLRNIVGDQLIEVGDADALVLGVNSVCIGQDVVMCHCSDELRAKLEARGYHLHVVPLGSFNRSGGAAYCLTLRLDNRTMAGAVLGGNSPQAGRSQWASTRYPSGSIRNAA